MDNSLIKKVLKEHESRIVLLSNKVKWLEKERVADKLLVKALQTRLDNLKDSDVERMI